MTCIQSINFLLLLAAAIYIESPQFSNRISDPNIVEQFLGSWIFCKLESYSGGKTWQPEMNSPFRNFKIYETTGSILLKFAECIGLGLVDQVSWLWLKIWWRQTADKMYIFDV